MTSLLLFSLPLPSQSILIIKSALMGYKMGANLHIEAWCSQSDVIIITMNHLRDYTEAVRRGLMVLRLIGLTHHSLRVINATKVDEGLLMGVGGAVSDLLEFLIDSLEEVFSFFFQRVLAAVEEPGYDLGVFELDICLFLV